MSPFIVKDSKGNTFESKNIAGRKITIAVVATYPAHEATTFSKAVESRRAIVCCFTDKEKAKAKKVIEHNIKQFGIFDIEIIPVAPAPKHCHQADFSI